jgi:tetratricopeptide (TPR) repeat protein
MLFEDLRELREAQNHYEKSGEIYKLLNRNRDAANCYRTLALIYINLNENDLAKAKLKTSIELEGVAGNKLGLRISLVNLALLNEELKDFSAAKHLIENAIKIDQELNLSSIENDYHCSASGENGKMDIKNKTLS